MSHLEISRFVRVLWCCGWFNFCHGKEDTKEPLTKIISLVMVVQHPGDSPKSSENSSLELMN